MPIPFFDDIGVRIIATQNITDDPILIQTIGQVVHYLLSSSNMRWKIATKLKHLEFIDTHCIVKRDAN